MNVPIESRQKKKREEETDSRSKAEERSYYYDDAHGYEDFDPEKDDEESEPDD